jgi:hypothetical protein
MINLKVKHLEAFPDTAVGQAVRNVSLYFINI